MGWYHSDIEFEKQEMDEKAFNVEEITDFDDGQIIYMSSTTEFSCLPVYNANPGVALILPFCTNGTSVDDVKKTMESSQVSTDTPYIFGNDGKLFYSAERLSKMLGYETPENMSDDFIFGVLQELSNRFDGTKYALSRTGKMRAILLDILTEREVHPWLTSKELFYAIEERKVDSDFKAKLDAIPIPALDV